jgi:DNA-damage-inducible protein D
MSTNLTLFHFEEGSPSFEDLGRPNGQTRWTEADLRTSLGYGDPTTFRKVIIRAMQACLSLGLQCEENFTLHEGEYLITRFGCYLVAMSGSTKKPEVAAAQIYFATLAETFHRHIEHADGIERIIDRSELSDGMKSLSSTASRHGVTNYAYFQDKGYRGMYNMSLRNLCGIRGVADGKHMLDRMGKEELAANRFRVTQTDAKIKNGGIRGQANLEEVAFEVGRTVRETMIRISGTAPEHLPLAEPIQQVRKKVKGTNRKFKSLDKPRIKQGAEERRPSSSS